MAALVLVHGGSCRAARRVGCSREVRFGPGAVPAAAASPGWQPDLSVGKAAVAGGCEALLEWLVEQHPGCLTAPPGGPSPYVPAAAAGTLGTLIALRHLGVPWGARGVVVSVAACDGFATAALHWLVEQGAPVGSYRDLQQVCEWLGVRRWQGRRPGRLGLAAGPGDGGGGRVICGGLPTLRAALREGWGVGSGAWPVGRLVAAVGRGWTATGGWMVGDCRTEGAVCPQFACLLSCCLDRRTVPDLVASPVGSGGSCVSAT